MKPEDEKAKVDESIAGLQKRLELWKEQNETNSKEDDMRGLNRVVVAGNLTKKPDMKELSSGTYVTDMGLAINEHYKNKAGEDVKKVCFIDVVAWGRQAEACNKYLEKGSPILIEGRLQFDQWESANGEKRNKVLLRADRIEFLSKESKVEADDKPVVEVVDDKEPLLADADF